jgi:hypothetical protein
MKQSYLTSDGAHYAKGRTQKEKGKPSKKFASAVASHSQVESEQDAALAEIRDLKQHLTALLADLEIVNADKAQF